MYGHHEFDLFEAIYTTRSMRRLKPDPVPPALIVKVIEAATMGPSGHMDCKVADVMLKGTAGLVMPLSEAVMFAVPHQQEAKRNSRHRINRCDRSVGGRPDTARVMS